MFLLSALLLQVHLQVFCKRKRLKMGKGGIWLLLCWECTNLQHLHNVRASWYACGKAYHPGRPRKARGMCWWEPHEIQRQVHHAGKSEPPAAVWLALDWVEQLCWKGSRAAGKPGAEQEPAACPGSKENKQHLGLCDLEILKNQRLSKMIISFSQHSSDGI